MLFFIDTADLEQIKEAVAMGILDGVTTNPSLMAKQGIKGTANIMAHYRTICNIANGDVSAEVLSTSFDGMIKEGKELADLHNHIVVKVPATLDGIKAIKWFSERNIKTNCTLIFSAGQALLAAKAGATYVSPFLGRIDDINWDGMDLIEKITHIYNAYHIKTKVLVASVRNALHIVKAAGLGAHVCTAPLSAIKGLINHPLTDIGLAKFVEDAKNLS